MKKRARNKPSDRPARASGWGGTRPGAGRPPAHALASEPHKPRPALAPGHAVLVTARIVEAMRRLDAARTRAILERAIDLSLAREDFRIVHLGVRTTRLELIVEAADRLALARGMQGFQVSAARCLNRAARRTGGVFADRYRARVLGSRAAVRAAVAGLPRAAQQRIGTPESALFADAV